MRAAHFRESVIVALEDIQLQTALERGTTRGVNSRLAAMGKDLVRGLAIGLGIYVVWVVIHMILFGMLGD